MDALIQEMIQYHCPRWKELPQLELYIDQVVLYLQDHLSLFDAESIVTPAMINNYVKQKIVMPPVRKKYAREHMAHLFIIFTMKRVTSIAQLGEIIEYMKGRYSLEQAYDLFCEELEYALKSAFAPEEFPPRFYQREEKAEVSILRSMTTTFAHMMLTNRLLAGQKETERA